MEVANADRAAGSNQREQLEADWIGERAIDLQREVPGLVDYPWHRQVGRTENWQRSRAW